MGRPGFGWTVKALAIAPPRAMLLRVIDGLAWLFRVK
jgi:hypothetical protein